MEHSEFSIGCEFYCGAQKWRCTDVGSRVVVAISLGPHPIVTSRTDGSGRVIHQEQSMTDDPSWLSGPPYAIPERVFDEFDLGGCHLTQEED